MKLTLLSLHHLVDDVFQLVCLTSWEQVSNGKIHWALSAQIRRHKTRKETFTDRINILFVSGLSARHANVSDL